MPYIASNIPKSIFYSALVSELLRIASSSLLYKDFNEKAMELLNRMKAKGANPSGVETNCPKLFENMRKRLPILEKFVMKFVLNFIFKLDKIYYLTHDTLSAEFLYFTHDTL